MKLSGPSEEERISAKKASGCSQRKASDGLLRFERITLDAENFIWVGRLPDAIKGDASLFDKLWEMHPQEFHQLKMFGRPVNAPRWQQAYGRDYHYTGTTNVAKPVDPLLTPFLQWAKENIDPSLNGLLLNWYDAELRHYIGPHRDSTHKLVPGSPIVTISLGNERTFRLRPAGRGVSAALTDLPVRDGSVFVMPWETNLRFTHAVPFRRDHKGRRISITLRVFQPPLVTS